MVRLLIKTHDITGLKYLCITTRDDYDTYKGSGVYWKRHLKVHGNDIRTDVLYESKENDARFKEMCMYYSGLYNIVEDTSWANLMPENGNIANQYFTPTDEWKYKISEANKEYYKNNPKACEAQALKFKKWIEDEDNYQRWKEAQMQGVQSRSKDSVKRAAEKISKTKLNWSDEKRNEVYSKVSDSLKTSKARKDFEKRMKVERLGKNNPAAVKVIWFDKVFNTHEDFKEYILNESEYSFNKATSMLASDKYPECYKDKPKKTYEKITCPHCNKTNNATSSFKRWHFDNCKHKD